MLFFRFLFILPILSLQATNSSTSFCICEISNQFNCSDNCAEYQILNYDSIHDLLSNYSNDIIEFLIVGTNHQSSSALPTFSLDDFQNISAKIYFKGSDISPDGQEQIILKTGTITANSSFYFSNLNIHVEKGQYLFQNIQLNQTSFTSKGNSGVIWKQFYLISDFPSLSSLTKSTEHIGPKKGAIIKCDKDVNHIQFLPNLKISFNDPIENKSNCILDLSQVSRKYNTTLLINSHHLNLTFSAPPTDKSEIPNIVFSMNSNSNVYIDSEQFNDDNMIVDKITFIHNSKTLYLNSRNGTIPPTFNYIGSGYTFVNDRTRNFYQNYCICASADCSSKCSNGFHIINDTKFESIEATVVGNPNDVLTYLIVDSSDAEGSYPVFNIEHFEDKTLTLQGHSANDHVGFVGDGTDAIGRFHISSLTIHTQHGDNLLLFPNVTFQKVKVYQLQEKKENENSSTNFIKTYTLRSYYLIMDYETLKQFIINKVDIESPARGIEVYAELSKWTTLYFFNSNSIGLNNLTNISLALHTTFTLHAYQSVAFYISPTFPDVVTSFPKVRVYFTQRGSKLFFPQQWSSQLSDISAKVTIVHGDKDVHINGEYDKETKEYKTKPPIVDHVGNGPYYINGHLSNFKSTYCLCEGTNCQELCAYKSPNYGTTMTRKSVWPPIDFSEDSIAKTAIENPTRHIEYYIHGSTPTHRPFFGLHSFQSKSFSIIGCPDSPGANQTQYVSLEGSEQIKEMVSSSVSHIFTNVNILLATSGVYFFNNVVFTNCQITKNPEILKNPKSVFKIIQTGMTIDMPTLNSFGINKNDEMSLPTYTYLRVNGNGNLSKIVIDDEFHLNLFNSDQSLKGRIDVSLLKKNHAELRTTCGDSQDNPIIIEWNPNNGIKSVKAIPNFIVDVSNMYGDDVYVKFTGRTWHGKFRNITGHIKFKCGPINLHIISEKKFDSKGRGTKIVPPFVGFEGDGDIYIDEEKQISSKVYGNGIMNLAGSMDYEDDLNNLLTPVKLFFILIFTCASIFFTFILGIKTKKWFYEHERYARIANNISSLQESISSSDMNDLQIERFNSI